MLGFLNPAAADTQASIGNVTEKLPTLASTMNNPDLISIDAAAAGARNFYPYFHHDIVQTPEAKSRTEKIVINNSIPVPAQTDKQRANDNNWWSDVAKATAKVAWIVAPAVLAAQERNKQKIKKPNAAVQSPDASANTYYDPGNTFD